MERIPESELILNRDGSVYHLNLLPEDISTRIITVGDPDRVERVASFFDNIRIKRKNREFETITGSIGNIDLTVLSTGIGTSNIDIVMNELDALVNVDLKERVIKPNHTSLKIFRLGTSGAIQPDIPLGSLLISEKSLALEGIFNFYPESDLWVCGNWTDLDTPGHGLKSYLFEADHDLLQAFSPLGIKGITATLGGFYAPQGRSIRLESTAKNWLLELQQTRWQNQRLTNIEMETAGIYGFAKMLGHKALSVNAILANRMEGTFVKNPQKVIDQMIENCLQMMADGNC